MSNVALFVELGGWTGIRLGSGRRGLKPETLRRAEGNQGVAAEILGLSRQALNKRLSRLKHDRPLDTGEG